MFGYGGKYLALQQQQRPLREVCFSEMVGNRLSEFGVAIIHDTVTDIADTAAIVATVTIADA